MPIRKISIEELFQLCCVRPVDSLKFLSDFLRHLGSRSFEDRSRMAARYKGRAIGCGSVFFNAVVKGDFTVNRSTSLLFASPVGLKRTLVSICTLASTPRKRNTEVMTSVGDFL